jgi:hypothetical protein
MVGVIIGKAFDKALAICIARWPIYLVGWAIFAVLYLVAAPQAAIVAVGLIWTLVVGGIVGAALRPGFTVSASGVARFLGVCALLFIAVLAAPAIVLAIVLPLWLHADQTGTATAASTAVVVALTLGCGCFACWLGDLWSLAPTIALIDGDPVENSLGGSWRMAKRAFWPQMGFCLLIIGAQFALIFIPSIALGVILGITHSELAQQGGPFITRYWPAIIMPTTLYGQTASWYAWILRLDYLKSREAQASLVTA